MSTRRTRRSTLLLAVSIGLLSGGCGQPVAVPQQAVPAPSAAPTTTDEALDIAALDIAALDTAGRLPASDAPSAAAGSDATPSVTVRPATAAQGEDVPPPSSLEIEGTDISVDVVEVGIASNAEMEIPESFYEAGWYRYGPAPGASSGNAVLAAHIDIGTEIMPFAQLKNVPVGAVVTVGREGAEPVRYEVTGVRHEPKATLDTEEIFRRGGEHQLMIITCGGKWLAAQNDYEDNVVLTASPL